MRRVTWGHVCLLALVAAGLGATDAGAAADADRAAIEAFVAEQAAGFGHGGAEVRAAKGAPLIWVSGPDTMDQLWAAQLGLLQSSAPAVGAEDDGDVTVTAKPKGLQIGLADDRSAAWVAFTLDVTLTGPKGKKGKSVKASYRVTEILGKQADGWAVLAAHWSVGVKNAAAVKRGKAGGYELQPLAKGDQHVGPAEIAEAVSIAIMPGIGLTMADVTSNRADVFGFGSDPGESWAGAKLKKVTSKWKFEMEHKGPMIVGYAPGNKVAWGLANVEARFGSGKKAYTIVYRVMLVLVHNPDNEGEMDWDVVQVHFSIAE